MVEVKKQIPTNITQTLIIEYFKKSGLKDLRSNTVAMVLKITDSSCKPQMESMAERGILSKRHDNELGVTYYSLVEGYNDAPVKQESKKPAETAKTKPETPKKKGDYTNGCFLLAFTGFTGCSAGFFDSGVGLVAFLPFFCSTGLVSGSFSGMAAGAFGASAALGNPQKIKDGDNVKFTPRNEPNELTGKVLEVKESKKCADRFYAVVEANGKKYNTYLDNLKKVK